MACCSPKTSIICSVVLAVITTICLTVAIVSSPLMNQIIHEGIKSQRVVTDPSSTGYDQWVSSDFKDAPTQYFYVYLFNVTNTDDVMSKGAKPKLAQVGPFVYTAHNHFFNISWSKDKNTVDLMNFQRYNWQKEGSVSDPSTTYVTLLNVPYAAVRSTVDPELDWWSAMAFDLITAAAEQSLFINVTVNDFVWGFESPFLKWINETVSHLDSTTFGLQTNDTSEDACFNRLKGQYDTYYTGNNDSSLLNSFHQWNGMTNLQVWNSTYANTVLGSDALGFPIGLEDNQTLTVFVDTLYRHLHIWYNSTEEIHGITLRKYWLDQNSFANISMGNRDYWLNAPHGMSNMSGPMNSMQGSPVPIYISLPYFLMGSETLQEAVEFLPPHTGPIFDLHNTEIGVEPTSGLTMKAAKRVQINVKMDPSFFLYPNLPTTYFPVAWFELSTTISEPLATKFKNSVLLGKDVAFYAPFAFGGLTVVFLVATSLTIRTAHKLRVSQPYELIDGCSDVHETIQG